LLDKNKTANRTEYITGFRNTRKRARPIPRKRIKDPKVSILREC